MEKILLIEPDYDNKYTPLGLMKISYYYKEIKNALVWFSKGELPNKVSQNIIDKMKEDKYYTNKYGNSLDNHISMVNKTINEKSWDKIFITTLFTFEYNRVISTINYAKSIIDDHSKIYVGGVLATLMADKLREDTNVTILTGQLTDTSVLGYDDNVNVDILTPDYSLLANTEYKYSNEDAYYTYTTRGCGMNCGFCAVRILEPEFIPYIPIKEQIENIDRLYGSRKDMILMDNNVLKSKYFETIVDDLIDLGFYKGAKYINPKTGRYNGRFVDFNQGLDAKLLTPHKAELLSKLAIKPARVAFDHIEDKETYLNTLKVLIDNGITDLSNYILYNSDSFSGKGSTYKADSPEDLYERFKVNVELQQNENERLGENIVKIYSFPMKYIPLEDIDRKYIGPNWNKKYLRAIQVMLLATSGKGVSSPSYFSYVFGDTKEEFLNRIKLPESYLRKRGIPKKSKSGEDPIYNKKLASYEDTLRRIQEWERLYNSLHDDERVEFDNIISSNKFNYENYKIIKSNNVKNLYLHYLSNTQLLDVFKELISNNENADIKLFYEVINSYKVEGIKHYMQDKAPFIYKDFLNYIVRTDKSKASSKVLNTIMDEISIIDILDSIDIETRSKLLDSYYHFSNKSKESSTSFKYDTFLIGISKISNKKLYTCLHSWIRNRRIEGLGEFTYDIVKLLISCYKLENDNEIDYDFDKDSYIKEEMLKSFFKITSQKEHTVGKNYNSYKYDIFIYQGYDPYHIFDQMREYQETYCDRDFFEEDVYYDYRDYFPEDEYKYIDDDYSLYESSY